MALKSFQKIVKIDTEVPGENQITESVRIQESRAFEEVKRN